MQFMGRLKGLKMFCNNSKKSISEEIEGMRNLAKEDEDFKIFKFFEHQLGVLDDKAKGIITIDGVLIALIAAFLGIEVIEKYTANERVFLVVAAFVLGVSAMFCIKVLQTEWASSFFANGAKAVVSEAANGAKAVGFKELLELRNRKTCWLHVSIYILALGLAFLVINVALAVF